jgi:hypothetical protein
VAPERKAAKHDRLAALEDSGGDEPRKPTPDADLGQVRKTANPQGRQTTLAALPNPDDEAADVLAPEALP